MRSAFCSRNRGYIGVPGRIVQTFLPLEKRRLSPAAWSLYFADMKFWASVGVTVLGAVIIGVLNNGLVLLNVSPFWQQVVKGGVILLAVIIDKANSKND